MAHGLVSTGIQFPDATIQTDAITYTWLDSNIFKTVQNCGGSTNAINCYGSGPFLGSYAHELIDLGGTIQLRSVRRYVNCDCVCTCD